MPRGYSLPRVEQQIIEAFRILFIGTRGGVVTANGFSVLLADIEQLLFFNALRFGAPERARRTQAQAHHDDQHQRKQVGKPCLLLRQIFTIH